MRHPARAAITAIPVQTRRLQLGGNCNLLARHEAGALYRRDQQFESALVLGECRGTRAKRGRKLDGGGVNGRAGVERLFCAARAGGNDGEPTEDRSGIA
jgi:hypothetical protein